MPSKSEKQKKFMRIAAHSKSFAEKVGIDQEVAQEFYEEDKRLEKSSKKEKKK